MGQAAAKSDAWTEKPLIVLLKDPGPGQEPKLYVNSKQVGWDDLAGVLKQELGQRSQWTVYVGADDCLPWENVAFVIDAARGLHAKVFLTTGGKRKPCGQPRGFPVTM
jgi:biopolymer transport protein ExbD